MNLNIPRPTWRKPPPPKSFWQKFFTGLFGALGGFWAIMPIPKNIFSRPMSYFIRISEQKTGEKVETKDSDRKVKEIISQDVSRQVAIWKEAADEEKDTVVYKVQSGDSLWKIAQNQYNWGERWIDIWTANRVSIKEPNLIFAGQELKIPKQILRRTALFQSPSPAPRKSAVKTAGGELMKRQIISETRSVEQAGSSAAKLINLKLGVSKLTDEQKTIALQVANQINGNIADARSYARQAQSITDYNANSVDLLVRALDLGRETVQLARAAESIPSPAFVSTIPAMAWSQDSAGNIKYYTGQNGAWVPSEVNPIGNIGAIYGTQDITQTPEYKSGKIIQISPQPAPAAPSQSEAPVPYGGAVLNTEQQKIYEELKSSRGAAAEQYKQAVLNLSPLAVAANAIIVKADKNVIAFNNSIASQTVGESLGASPVQISSALEKSITATAASIIAAKNTAPDAPKITPNIALAEHMKVLAATSFSQVQQELAAGETKAAVTSSADAIISAIAANVAAPASKEAAEVTVAAVGAVSAVQTSDTAALAKATQFFGSQQEEGEGGAGFQGAPPGMSLTESNPQLAAEIANAINSPFGIVTRVVAPAYIGVPLTIIAGEIQQSLTTQGLNPETGTPAAHFAGQAESQQGFQTQRAGEIASQNAPAPASEAEAAPAPATSFGLAVSDITADANFGIFSGISVSQSGDSITVTGPGGQSAVATIAADGTITAVS